MTLTTHRLAADTFVPMLETLAGIIDKGMAHAAATGRDPINARLAPDMYPLAKQVEIACRLAHNGFARLSGRPDTPVQEARGSWDDLKSQIAETVDFARATSPADFADADISLELGGKPITMNPGQFLLAWTLPNFYFHVVTAYDILRHHGVELGKRDYLARSMALIRPS